MRKYPIEGKVVVVTGAARGIGAALARQLASEGAKVALVGRKSDALWATARECGPDAMAWEADITDEVAMRSAIAGIVERFGGIDVVVANAGVCEAELVRSGLQDVAARIIEVNLLGTHRTLRLCLPHVIERKGYCLVVASVSAFLPMPGLAAYCASKAGGAALARCVRAEVRHRGVDVGTAYLSLVDTGMVSDWHAHPAFGALPIPWPLNKVSSTAKAADAVTAGIRRRARSVDLPGWVRPLRLASGVLAPLSDRISGRFGAAADLAQQATLDTERLTEGNIAQF